MKNLIIKPNQNYIISVLILITVIITLQSITLEPKKFDGIEYTRYNNFKIFQYSFFHLIEGKDLYKLYPEEHWDYYKYSPTFALAMGIIAYFPDFLGLLIWNILNVLILFYAVWFLKIKPDKKLFIIGFMLIEWITSIQNAQSNALISGLMVMSFIFLEDKKPSMGSLAIVLSMFIKLFGGVALLLFLFYPQKNRSVLYTFIWILILGLLPLTVISVSQLLNLYKSWFDLLMWDKGTSIGLSIEGWLISWFNIKISTSIILGIGIVFLLIPFLKKKLYDDYFYKLLFLSSILIWVVIFNHKAESPTFIIAVTGIAIWYFAQERKTENLLLLVVAFVFTVLSPTEVFPSVIRNKYVIPYVLKAVPCILVWVKINYDMITFDLPENSNG